MEAVKKGKRRGVQRFHCKNCGKNFQNKHRRHKLVRTLWRQYIWGKQTIKQLVKKYQRSEKWIRQQLDKAPTKSFRLYPQPIVAIADCTFWGRGYGVLVFRSFDLKQNLYWIEVTNETVAVYREARKLLEELGYTFEAVVIDGKKGVREVFSDIPVQICQFHQMAIVTRYLTKRPKLEAGKELRMITLALTELTENMLLLLLDAWHEKWGDFLKERTVNPFNPKKWFYTHKRIRSAYRSLKTNAPYLFTYQRYTGLNIPNTTNSLDGSFKYLKQLIGIHSGLKRGRRWRVIQEVLAK